LTEARACDKLSTTIGKAGSSVDRRYRFNQLLDFYGALLTDHAREFMRLRLEEDMSLQEIAESFGISRQAVHDSVSRSEKQLEEFEEKLSLVKRFDEMRQSLLSCEEELKTARQALDRAEELFDKIRQM
jgi:predicted DNA-binding protein YlxM (UPF0122 family)